MHEEERDMLNEIRQICERVMEKSSALLYLEARERSLSSEIDDGHQR